MTGRCSTRSGHASSCITGGTSATRPVDELISFQQTDGDSSGAGDALRVVDDQVKGRIHIEVKLGTPVKDFPDRFIPSLGADGNLGMKGIEEIVRAYETFGIKAVSMFPALDCATNSMEVTIA